MSKKEKFIVKCENKFGNQYDYSMSDYIDSKTKIDILCNKHNIIFKQTPAEHLRGKLACNLCTRNPKVNSDFFINKAKSIHGDKYDYSKTIYVDSTTKVKIICKQHGVFEMLPNNHYKQNCPNCFNEDRFLTTELFIDLAKKIHGDKYCYLNSIYTNSKNRIKISCLEHGEYEQIPNDHLSGKGCPKCGFKYNNTENEIKDFIKGFKLSYIENTKNIISPLELDIYIPSHNLAIEFNGLYWHSEIYKSKNYHLNKTLECEKQGIQLIHIFEDEWLYKKDIVKSRLTNIFGMTPERIYARKCQIKEVTHIDSKKFLNMNHIQGQLNSSIRLGLYLDDELVSLMTFGGLRKALGTSQKDGSYELLRFCNKLNTTVIGGANKLLKNFINLYKPKEIISYADRRWSIGNLYIKLGFDLNHYSQPNYFYVINDKRNNRFNYRKDVLIKEGFDKNKTEHEIMLERKIYRIYDSGTICFKLMVKK
jgi:hypothetical protein